MESTVAVDYRPAAGQSVGQPFLRFRIPKFGLKTGPDGARLYGADSVFITMTIDSVKLSVDFQPSGVTFSEVFAAGLIIWYANANPDLNCDGVVDSTDQALAQQLGAAGEDERLVQDDDEERRDPEIRRGRVVPLLPIRGGLVRRPEQ
jgi:hypothetical protein